jgi:hypothetical protein
MGDICGNAETWLVKTSQTYDCLKIGFWLPHLFKNPRRRLCHVMYSPISHRKEECILYLGKQFISTAFTAVQELSQHKKALGFNNHAITLT